MTRFTRSNCLATKSTRDSSTSLKELFLVASSMFGENYDASNLPSKKSLRAEIRHCVSTICNDVTGKIGSLVADFAYSPVKNENIRELLVCALKRSGHSFDYLFEHQLLTKDIEWNYGPIPFWDVSAVTNMKELFYRLDLDRSTWKSLDLSAWDTSNVVSMEGMFKQCGFNTPIGMWNVRKVKNMSEMFFGNRQFNQSLNGWNVGAVEYMDYMFREAVRFDQPLDEWRPLSLISARFMFMDAIAFNSSLDGWMTGVAGHHSEDQFTLFMGLLAGAKSFEQTIDWLPLFFDTKVRKPFAKNAQVEFFPKQMDYNLVTGGMLYKTKTNIWFSASTNEKAWMVSERPYLTEWNAYIHDNGYFFDLPPTKNKKKGSSSSSSSRNRSGKR